MLDSKIRPVLSGMTFMVVDNATSVYNRFSFPVISTGRSFSYYRRIFFSHQSPRKVFNYLEGKRTVDIGCGLTPYVSNSMFQACHKEGIEFYGVDPKLADGFKFGPFDRAKITFVGGGWMNKNAPGLNKGIGTLADDLPFEDDSIDLFLSCYVLFAWVNDEAVLDGIFREFYRVLKPGAEVRIYPAPYYRKDKVKHEGLREIMEQFEINQKFPKNIARLGTFPPAYMRTMTKK